MLSNLIPTSFRCDKKTSNISKDKASISSISRSNFQSSAVRKIFEDSFLGRAERTDDAIMAFEISFKSLCKCHVLGYKYIHIYVLYGTRVVYGI